MLIKKLIEKIKKYFFHDTNEPDWYLVGTILFLTAFGLIMLCSAGVAVGWQKFHDPYYYFKHQLLVGVIPGLILMFLFSKFDYRKLKNYAPGLLLFSIALLVLVFIPGIGASWGTSRSWIYIFGFSIQPSEIVKLTFLLYLASWLSSKEESHLKNFQYGFVPFLFVLGIISLLTVLEPDTGTMMIIILMSLSVYFTAGGKVLHLTWLGVLGAGALALLIKFSPYRGERFTTFLHPELDPLGTGYHINQALLAVGSGGWFGKGYGHSIQKFNYLPEVTGDSIFAVVSEELGFIFASIIVAVFIFLAIRGLKLAQRCEDTFGKLLVVGIISWFAFQAFFNIGAMVGILPLTGVTLPFISYGGTSIMASLAAAGILVNISKQNSYR
ncbi:MAG: putative lipid II flippase FtsW [Patescibacteria group bacterium]|jgi:cell division protein FtsW